MAAHSANSSADIVPKTAQRARNVMAELRFEAASLGPCRFTIR